MATFNTLDCPHLVTLQIKKAAECLEVSRSVEEYTLDLVVQDTIKLIDRFFNLDFYLLNSFNTYLTPYYCKPVSLVKDWYFRHDALESCSTSIQVDFKDQFFIFTISEIIKSY